MTIKKIKSQKAKNRLRGLQGKEANHATLTTLNLLRKDAHLDDAPSIANWLYGTALFNGLGLPEEFPREPANIDRNISLEVTDLKIEVAMLCARMIENGPKIIRYFAEFKRLNNLINEERLTEAQEAIEYITNEFGYSIRVLLKASYIYTHPKADELLVARAKAYLDDCGMGARNFVARGAVDIQSADYSFLSIRRNIASREKAGHSTPFSNDIGEWLFFPIQRTASGFSAQLRSQRQASLIDAASSLFENTLNLDGGARFGLNIHEMDGLGDLCRAWSEFSQTPPHDLINRSNNGVDKAFQLYRASISWLEISSIAQLRARVDALYRDPNSRRSLCDGYSDDLNKEYYRRVTSLKDLCVTHSEKAGLTDYYDPKTAGNFDRTLAVLDLLKSPLSDKSLAAHELLALMNSTCDMDTLLGEPELDVIMSNGDGSQLFKVIIFTLKSQHSGSPRAASRLRSAFEKLVRDEYRSDIIAFFKDMRSKAPVVAQYLFELCDERFLELLYDIIPQDVSVLQVRSELLLWYADAFEEKSYADRARIMQIDARVQQVRGAIDDTRIYVDKVRFSHWLQDNYLDEILDISRATADSSEIMQLNGFGGQDESFLPEVRMSKVLQAAYNEFCMNTHFGIASYLARRIRHGTVAGVLTSKVEEAIQDVCTAEFSENNQVRRYLTEWLDIYKKNVDKLGREYLQVYSPKAKPHGLISTNIWSTPRVEITRGSLSSLFNTALNENVVDIMAGIIQSCWQLIQPDLARIRRHLTSSRTLWGTLNASDFPKPSAHDGKSISTFCASTNNITDELFKSVVSWFHQPQEMVPSAPLTLIFEAAMKEVQEVFSNFEPILVPLDESEIILTGGTYHIVYDALYILLGNAAKHLKQPVKISRKLELVRNEHNSRYLLVSISTGCSDAQADNIKAKMDDALWGDNSDANNLDRGSGFKKLAHLRDTTREFKSIDYTVENGAFTVNMNFELLA